MTIDCARFQDMVDELALDLLTGTDRADALGHLDDCTSCRREVASLIDAAEELLLLAPVVAPDAGFDERVLSRLRTPSRPVVVTDSRGPRRRELRRRAPRVAGLVAAVAAAVLLVGAVASRGGGHPSAVVTGTMVSGHGAVVGHVVVRGGDPAVVSMRLPGWDALVRTYGDTARVRYRLAVDRRDGSHRLVALAAPHDGRWRVDLAGRADNVTSLSIVDGGGRPWCSARLA